MGRVGRVGMFAAVAAALTVLTAPVAGADPAQPSTANPSTTTPNSTTPNSTQPTTSESEVSQVSEPSIPMPVRDGALGYLATRSSTLWLKDRGADQVIANLPVPQTYSAANRQMAKTLKQELDSAAETPGACLQIIIDGADPSGGVFNYGFFAVEKQYCPK
ncbi:hypothetical protein [Gordonia neofelifaecis]|uniref:DUF732 domain-containing protein n=1 Tax=Gordonia neofelifaecis NRRL B-59395 TaxID=644548 RepID=F1YI57_9ACTN|nr:hypothetical protein [Gordonia neofelifaecis]EGD55611.1 hypothetical protein SCNU_07858 [Gordonia neofelifaecis NRRL B-59395]